MIKLYRYMAIHRLIEIFESEKLTFVKPYRWNDAFENYLSKVTFKDKTTGKSEHIDYLDNVFLSCWTEAPESDLFWRAYCPDKNGVCIMVNKYSFDDIIRIHSKPDCFSFDNVKYHPYRYFKDELEDEVFLKDCFKNLDKSNLISYLFKKRNEFDKEQEYRIVFDKNKWLSYPTDSDFFRINFEPNNLVKEIKFDPAMPDELCDVYKEYFINKGFPEKGQIKRSLLYKYRINKEIEIN